MTEMHDFYDVVNALRNKCHLSVRQLAREMGIAPTTLSSIFSRRPLALDREILVRLGIAFDLPWYVLLNKSAAHEVETSGSSRMRVTVLLSHKDIEMINERIIKPYQCPKRYIDIQNDRRDDDTGDDGDFRRSILFVLNKLNDEGLMEAMRRILDVANKPKYCKLWKEDDSWQEEKHPTGVEPSSNGRMGDTKQE